VGGHRRATERDCRSWGRTSRDPRDSHGAERSTAVDGGGLHRNAAIEKGNAGNRNRARPAVAEGEDGLALVGAVARKGAAHDGRRAIVVKVGSALPYAADSGVLKE